MGLRKVKGFQKRATHAHPNFQGVPRVQTMGAFRYARPTGQRPVELTKWIWHDIVRKKQNFQPYRSVSFMFRPNFDYSLVRLETRIFENERYVGLDRPVKEDHLWRWTTFPGKFPPGSKRSIYVLTEISGNFGIMGSTQRFILHPGFCSCSKRFTR